MQTLRKLGMAVIYFVAGSAAAQNYAIDWFSIDGGSGASTGRAYSVMGTIGQPDVGPVMAGGSYSLTGGFWSLLTVVPTPGAPTLTITLTATNTAIISWPSPSTGFVLQQNGNLATPNWLAPLQPVNDDGTNKFIVVDLPAANRFYRLMHP